MSRDLSFRGFLRDLGARLCAGAVVVGVFFGLGYLDRTDVPGISTLLGTRLGFFATAFALIGTVALGWIAVQQYRG
jgi:hypothetical protein